MLQTVTWEMSKRHVWGVMSRGLIIKSVIIIMKHIAAVSVLVRGWEDEMPKAQELDSEQRRHKRLCRRKTTGINAGKVPSWLIWKLWWDSFFCYPQPRSGDTRPHLLSIYRLSICLSIVYPSSILKFEGVCRPSRALLYLVIYTPPYLPTVSGSKGQVSHLVTPFLRFQVGFDFVFLCHDSG